MSEVEVLYKQVKDNILLRLDNAEQFKKTCYNSGCRKTKFIISEVSYFLIDSG